MQFLHAFIFWRIPPSGNKPKQLRPDYFPGSKIFLKMKLTALVSFVACLQVSAHVHSQSITLDEKNAPLVQVFNSIRTQSGIYFFYDLKDLQAAKPVTVKVKNATLEEALRLCFQNQPVTYVMVNQTVVVKLQQQQTPARDMQTAPRPVIVELTGRVVNETGEPLAGATVSVKNGSRSTVTDNNGQFRLELPDGKYTVVISYVGFVTQTIETSGQSPLNITLALDANNLTTAEVVVTALGINREKKSLVYATQSIKPSQLTEVRDPNNVLNSFQGKVANAQITQSSGGVGSSAKIILRGNRSIQGTNSALIVVDGVPIFNTATNNMASNINPDDIESLTVLRGASAAALYGSQAGNGVVVITTKKGTKDKVAVTLNSGGQVETPFALPKTQNKYGQGNAGLLDETSAESWGAIMDGQTYTNHLGDEAKYSPQPDNIKDFFRTGLSFNNAIGVAGGTEKAQTYLSYTINNTQGIIPKNDLLRHAFNFRISNKITNRLSTDAKITYFNQDIKHRPRAGETNTPVLDIYQIPRSVSIDAAKKYETNDGIPAPTFWPSTIYGNPYWVINHDVYNETRDQLMGFVSAKFQIAPWLNITGRANLDKAISRADQSTAQGTRIWATQAGGYYGKFNVITTQKWFDAILEGNNTITKDLTANYHLGAIYQDAEFDQNQSVADGLNVANKFSLNFATNPAISSRGTGVQTQSVFGQVNLTYKNAIYFDGSIRNDWDSRLPAPHSFQYYSAGVSAVFSDLFTLPSSISFLKANINYAEVGNGGQFGLLTSSYAYAQGAGNGFLARSTVLPFPLLKPEIVRNIEASVEGRFLNRYGITLTYYKSNSFNQLLTINLPTPTGFRSQYINAGNIQNSGVEIVANASPVKTPAFQWDVDLNLSFNRNKVIKLSDGIDIVTLGTVIDPGGLSQVKVGGSYGDIVSYQWSVNDKGQREVTPAGRPLTTDVKGVAPGLIGNFNPKAHVGLTNSFSYKKFSARLLVDGRIGGIMISGTEMNLAFSGITEGTEAHREGGWVLGGVSEGGAAIDSGITAQQFWQTASGKRLGVGEFFAYDATSIRMREISIGYQIFSNPNAVLKTMRVAVTGRNLFWLYRGRSIMDIPGLPKRKMWFDPDMSLDNGNTYQGIEYGNIPSTRSLGINLNVTF